MTDHVGIAVVGTGDWGANLVRNFATVPGARLAALHDSDPVRLARTADVRLGDRLVDQLVRVICEAAHTGQAGDGKIFVYDVEAAIAIRTGTRGPAAV